MENAASGRKMWRKNRKMLHPRGGPEEEDEPDDDNDNDDDDGDDDGHDDDGDDGDGDDGDGDNGHRDSDDVNKVSAR